MMLDALEVAKLVQDKLTKSQSTARFARVIADQVNLRDINTQWWYVPVAYQQDPDHVYRLFEVFSEVEEELSEKGINVLIVPRLLPPPSSLVA